MGQDQMKAQTKKFAKQVISLCRQLPATRESRLIGGHFFRSGTSVGANYRAACRARSKADFISKLSIVLEETDESLYWMEILYENKIVNSKLLIDLMSEAKELIAIFVSSLNTAKGK
ncbi:MAG: four helix bundle protein [Thermodesulfobacteriota bacterium]